MSRLTDRSDGRPWRRPGGGRCPRCGRRAHAVPGPDGPRYMTLMFGADGRVSLARHVCLPPGARYGTPEIAERVWSALDVVELWAEMDEREGGS